jgi:protein phosphatase
MLSVMWLFRKKTDRTFPSPGRDHAIRQGKVRHEELAYWRARGPFDIIGDVHGCLDELLDLMAALGYQVERDGREYAVTPPQERKLAFLGDLVNRGPATPAVLRLVMRMMKEGKAICIAGNQDMRLLAAMHENSRKTTPGAGSALKQLKGEPGSFRHEAAQFLASLAGHYVLNEGQLVIAHAGLKEKLHGASSAKARRFAIDGQNTGKFDEFGAPIRYNWAADYAGAALVVYGHTPVPEPLWIRNTVNLDTGCVYGGYLTALRYPEREIVSVPARAAYYRSRKRFLPNKNLASAG